MIFVSHFMTACLDNACCVRIIKVLMDTAATTTTLGKHYSVGLSVSLFNTTLCKFFFVVVGVVVLVVLCSMHVK